MGALLAAFLAEIAIVTYRDIAGKAPNHTIAGLPLPADYLAAVIIFGGLGLVPKDSGASKTAALFGWGIVIATGLSLWNPQSPFQLGKSASSTSAAPQSTGGTVVGPVGPAGPVTATGAKA